MNKFTLPFVVAAFSILLVGCTMTAPTTPEEPTNTGENTTDTGTVAQYDANSWKELIPADCQSFFDGCNDCRRIEGGDEAACTRKFCETYTEPTCTDEAGDDQADDGDVADAADQEVDTQAIVDAYVGLSVEAATTLAAERGEIFRIVEQDGEPLAATMDYRPGRINASVAEGTVTSVTIE